MIVADEIKWRYKTTVACLIATSIFMSIGISGCSKTNTSETSFSETIATTETTIPSPTPSPTPVPTSTPSPTPTPVPTPEPRYVGPEEGYDEPIWRGNFVDPRSVVATIVENPDDITVVVNKYHSLELDYVPSDLVDAEHSMNQQLRAEANDAWNLLYDACLEATGQGLFLVSGFRDANIQSYLFYRSANLRGTEFACRKNAWPGRSEHQLGLALDITPAGQTVILDEFGETTTGRWVNEHCHEYGFIRRYQADYALETGYDQEAWHYRYVGVEVATYLYENHISLEAYWGMEQVLPYDE